MSIQVALPAAASAFSRVDDVESADDLTVSAYTLRVAKM
jgi:hypothetical protein